jgi:hypothetical protein
MTSFPAEKPWRLRVCTCWGILAFISSKRSFSFDVHRHWSEKVEGLGCMVDGQNIISCLQGSCYWQHFMTVFTSEVTFLHYNICPHTACVTVQLCSCFTGNVLPIYHSALTLCLRASTSLDHERARWKDNTSDMMMVKATVYWYM